MQRPALWVKTYRVGNTIICTNKMPQNMGAFINYWPKVKPNTQKIFALNEMHSLE